MPTGRLFPVSEKVGVVDATDGNWQVIRKQTAISRLWFMGVISTSFAGSTGPFLEKNSEDAPPYQRISSVLRKWLNVLSPPCGSEVEVWLLWQVYLSFSGFGTYVQLAWREGALFAGGCVKSPLLKTCVKSV